MSAEEERLAEARDRTANWQRWGPYLAERQWGTVREDYSPDGNCWDYFPFTQARSRAYRWGEDGLLGITDRECRLCFALALWNGRDPILKERLYGLTGAQGNHGEDAKECYYYLDTTPTYSYLKGLYKYPQAAFPYQRLLEENARRGLHQPEYELGDTGVFDQSRYFDIVAEYAKRSPNDILICITATNRGPEAATLHLLPTLWFRNTWSWGCKYEGCAARPRLTRVDEGRIEAKHETLGVWRLVAEPSAGAPAPEILLTENETNRARLFGVENATPYVKDAFDEYLLAARREAVNPRATGTKAAVLYRLDLAPGRGATVRLRLSAADEAPTGDPFGADFDRLFEQRRREADEFYDARLPQALSPDERNVVRQAWAGLLWSKQFYHYVIEEWIEGDSLQPAPPPARRGGRNRDWPHLYNRDVISMPDKWEYPWYAAWDLAFHTLAFADIDPAFAKEQLVLMLREWYMHPNGQIPAYEFNFSDVNPPVHAWACWRVFKVAGQRGERDRVFLSRVFQKLLINFTWWVNRKDPDGQHVFSGGFLGLDNIGLFDRSRPLPTGGRLEQADATAWMAFYCATMLSIAMELARDNPATEDVASKFFEHFVAIADAINAFGGAGLWDEEDGFYYDQIRFGSHRIPLKVRSLVGFIPLIAVTTLHDDEIEHLPGFRKRMLWFLENRRDLARRITYLETTCPKGQTVVHRLLAIPSRERLVRCLRYMLDEAEFLSPYGIRSLSRIYRDRPCVVNLEGREFRIEYEPGESASRLFGGNSNWRGPIWLPINYLIVESLEHYHHFYGDTLQVECPTGSGRMMNLRQVADEIARRLASIFLPDAGGRRPCHGDDPLYVRDPAWKNLLLFHEFFHGETGAGLGASHQTGWTALVARLMIRAARHGAETT